MSEINDAIDRLYAIGKEIEAKLIKADKYGLKSDDMLTSVNELINEAAKLFEDHPDLRIMSFDGFRQKFCPSLGRSTAYELRAQILGSKTKEQLLLAARDRQAKHMAKLKGGRPSVTDNPSDPVVMRATADGKPAVRLGNGETIKLDDLGDKAKEQVADALSVPEPEPEPEPAGNVEPEAEPEPRQTVITKAELMALVAQIPGIDAVEDEETPAPEIIGCDLELWDALQKARRSLSYLIDVALCDDGVRKQLDARRDARKAADEAARKAALKQEREERNKQKRDDRRRQRVEQAAEQAAGVLA
jgi:hypothetical protein